jgi:glycosyltransferase involved in cell wall biosynthesis
MPSLEPKTSGPSYRFGFVLTTAAGNQTRFLNLRKYAERDPDVECVWAPISHHLDSSDLAGLPSPLRTRAIVARQARPVMARLGTLDAVMFHAFEPYAWAAMRSLVHYTPRIVWSQDNPPLARPAAHPQSLYGDDHVRPAWRSRLRFAFDRWCAARTDLFLPFSTWAATVLTDDCGVPAARVHPMHVGLDLESWPHAPLPDRPRSGAGAAPNILFVGGDFERKGGSLLLDAFSALPPGRATLTLVTGRPPETLPTGVVAHTGIRPGDPLLRKLYAECDLFVLPTLADMSSWVVLEAMATGRPVVVSGVGGIPDLVEEGVTGFLIPPGDRGALAGSLNALLESPELRRTMGLAGRRRVEERFDARLSVPAILGQMKRTVHESRSGSWTWTPTAEDSYAPVRADRRGP